MSARTQRHQQARRNCKPQTNARRSHLWRYVAAVAFLLLTAFGVLATSNHALRGSAQASIATQPDAQVLHLQAASVVTTPTVAPLTSASYTFPQATSGTAQVSPTAAPTSSDSGDWILAPNNPPLPRTLGDIPPLPVAHSAHDPGFHPVQVQQRQVDGGTISLTCLNPVTNETELVVGKVGRDTIFTLNDPAKSHLRPGVIENVQVGDLVPTRDPQTGKTEYRHVTQTYKHLAHETLTAQLADAATGKVVDSLTATPEHPFFVPGRGAIPLGQLGIGTQVVARAGPPLVIASLVKREYPQGVPVYNFEVQGNHTYFVGVANGGTWVHNICEDGLAGVKSHLGRPELDSDESGANNIMLNRLQSALDEGKELEGADKDFYEHELYEKQLMDNGMGYHEAHATALKDLGVSEFGLHPPEVIRATPGWWSSGYYSHWGIGR